MFKVGDRVRVNCLIGDYQIIALVGNDREYAILNDLETGLTYPVRVNIKALLKSVQIRKPKNTFTIKDGQIEAAARFIVANNSYMHNRTTNEMIESIKRTIKRMVDEINNGKDSWYTGSAGYVVTIMREDENYYVVDVLVNPSVSQDKEFINVEEII